MLRATPHAKSHAMSHATLNLRILRAGSAALALALTASRAFAGDTVHVTYSVVDDWGSGYQGALTITNNASWTIPAWKLQFGATWAITDLWGGKLTYIGFTNFDWGSDLGDSKNRTSNAIASSHILALNYAHWHYSVVARYFHNGGQWEDGAGLNFGKGDFNVKSTAFGWYLVAGYNF